MSIIKKAFSFLLIVMILFLVMQSNIYAISKKITPEIIDITTSSEIAPKPISLLDQVIEVLVPILVVALIVFFIVIVPIALIVVIIVVVKKKDNKSTENNINK